mmetsp:Transcript_4242/g.10073  ORF Transcript_4242/g.10073 Transcript_4242/m.10073 type:complete len:571 (-) Transcript_4242:128-1840(-)
MLSPGSKRIRSPSKQILSPSKQLSSSPRGNRRNLSGSDLLCAAFLRHFRWLLAGIVGLGLMRILTMEPLTTIQIDVPHKNSYYTADLPTKVHRESLSPHREIVSSQKSDPSIYDELEASIDEEESINDMRSAAKEIMNDLEGKTTTKDDLFSSYKASNAPVILDGWNRTVQVHLIVDITGSVEVDPASKLLLAGVERSEFTQLKALTFIRPNIQTFEMFDRDPTLPLLFLIDWGSMDRDCHRLQLVLEEIRNETKASQESEEPYLLLVDSSGSTRQTGCSYLFQDNDEKATPLYAHTNDWDRIRLAKRGIVQNRYYDRNSKTIHKGEVAPNQWKGTPTIYNQPVLQFPLSLRESFVMGIQNITSGMTIVPTDDRIRPVDVGYFWKSGDYSHYGFYRRDIAKVVKTLHHSSLNKKKGTLMENMVEIAYDDAKDMEAGHVQVKHLEKLLQCKIVVVTQRDEWEDHYRLMESLASGALVMTDAMVALPEGFVDGVNIVVYESPKQLKELIRYYLKSSNKKKRLQIATRGYQLAMGRHRCWHRLEELLFGRPLTNFLKPDAEAPPKELPPDYRR